MSDHPTIKDLQAKGLPRMKWEDIFGGDPTDEEQAQLNEYLKIFALPTERVEAESMVQSKHACIRCGKALGGLMGTFRWGIANGEGACSECGWPARAHHRPKEGPLEFFEFILPYHPDEVKES